MNRNIIIKRIKRPQSTRQRGMTNYMKETKADFNQNYYFAFGKVVKRRSEDMTVDVKLDSGVECTHVSVRSLEWAGAGSIGYGERDLPPKDCLVLIIFPYGNIDEGLVLCSAYTMFAGEQTTKQQSELLVENKETEKLVIDEAGNKIKTDKSTGNIVIDIVAGASITLNINGATVEITADGAINVDSASGQDVKLNNGAQGANDFPNCVFSGALHCIDALETVKVP